MCSASSWLHQEVSRCCDFKFVSEKRHPGVYGESGFNLLLNLCVLVFLPIIEKHFPGLVFLQLVFSVSCLYVLSAECF